MALFQCKIFSKALYRSVNINVVLPLPDSNNDFFGAEIRYPQPGEKYPVLYLLHGFSADESDWQRFSRIESYAQAKNLAVVMPDGYNSFYEDSPFGAAYATYITEELPAAMEAIFPISGKRENRFIAGLSMGGGGTYKLALRFPEKYAAAASLSGGLNTRRSNSPSGVSSRSNEWRKFAYGQNFEYFVPQMSDLKQLLKRRVEEGADLPRLYQCCGTEDFTYPDNVAFRDYARELGVDLTWEDGPGAHNFDFWDPYIRKILDWLPITGKLVD